MIPREGSLRFTNFIGLKETQAREFAFPLAGKLRAAIESTGKAVFVEWPILDIREFADLIPHIEMAASFSPLLLPLYFQGDRGFLAVCVNRRPAAEELRTILAGLGRTKH
jgi:hypothetical protein